MTSSNWRNSCIGARPTGYLVLKMGSKRDLLHMKKFLCLRSTYFLFVHNLYSKYDARELNDTEMNMVSNTTRAKRRDSSIYARPLSSLCRICARKMTWANYRNSFIGARSTAYLCWIWSHNMSGAKRNSCIGYRSTAYLSWNSVRKKTRTKRKIHVFTVDLHNISTEYVLETWLLRTEEIRVFANCLYLSLRGFHVSMKKIS